MSGFIFSAEKLINLSIGFFERMGVSRDVAQVVSKQIVENCLYGHDSHGMILVPRFIKDIETGKIKPDAKTEVTRKTRCTASVNGNRGFGQVTMIDAVGIAVKLAKKAGISAVTVTNCNHVGILWNFLRLITEKGMVGMIWCVSGPEGGGGLVAPFGGRKRAIGSSPAGIGIPAFQMKPLVLDISTSAVAGGKIVLYAQQHKKLLPGWLIDEKGRPTTNPKDFVKNGKFAGALLPMAGYKGFGLGLAAEILGGLLTGYGASHMPDYREGQGVFMIAIDVKAFIPLKKFCKEVDAFFKYVKAVPTDPKTKEILIPGELEYRTREIRERKGISVTEAVWTDIIAVAKKLNLKL